MRGLGGGRFVAVVVVCLFAVDQLSKLWVQNNLQMHSSIDVIPGFFRLAHFANHGAIGGIGWDSSWTLPLLTIGSAILLILLMLLYRYYTRYVTPSWRLNLFLALAITPLAAHSFDRVRQGYVVDFLYFPGMPVFNFADLLPHFALIVLSFEVLSAWRARRWANAQRRPVLAEPW